MVATDASEWRAQHAQPEFLKVEHASHPQGPLEGRSVPAKSAASSARRTPGSSKCSLVRRGDAGANDDVELFPQ